MKIFKITLSTLVLALLFISCSSDDDEVTNPSNNDDEVTNPPEVTLSNEKQITGFQFLLSENPISMNVLAEINEETESIFAILPGNSLKTALIPQVSTSAEATLSPEGIQNFSNPVTYTVTAEDGSTKTYEVTVVTEKDALAAIHEANPGNSLGWDLDDPDLSNWEGVTLNNGVIVDLLIHNSLLTHIPPEIGHFRNLTDLGIHMNDFASIPPEIGQLKQLVKLSVGLNGNLNSVPPEIGQLENLEVLHLDNNSSLTSLPVEIGQLTKLTNLYINGNGFATIPQEICNLEINHGTEIFIEADITCE